ncbi:MAG: CoA ester lyase [Novosphingobium sp.]|nr:CoA ester lyase [Novosphingobium sp.]
MNNRSWLIVPGDDDDRLSGAVGTGADAIIVDLEDGVTASGKAVARRYAAKWIAAHRHQITEQKMARWVRINSLDSGYWRDDLVAVIPSAPDGIILPKASGPDDVRQLAAELYELEQRGGAPSGSIKIIPLVSETPRAAMTIGSYIDIPHQRMIGMAWGAADLSAVIGASRQKLPDGGGWTDAFRFVRAQTLLTAHACDMLAIDAAHASHTDTDGVRAAAQAARADGFTGMLAIHPAQVPIINEAFNPSTDELDTARKVVDQFAENPGSGSLELDGRVIQKPHLTLARRQLGLEARPERTVARTPMLRPA